MRDRIHPLWIVAGLGIAAALSFAAAARAQDSGDQTYSNPKTWRDVRHDQRSGELGSCALLDVGCPALRIERRDPDPRPSGVRVYGWRSFDDRLPSCNAPGSLPVGLRCRP